MGSAAGSFFRLRPSGFSAPDSPLLKRRLAGHGVGLAGYDGRGRLRRTIGAIWLQNNIGHRWRLHAVARLSVSVMFLVARATASSITTDNSAGIDEGSEPASTLSSSARQGVLMLVPWWRAY